jgi:hypothetical protein
MRESKGQVFTYSHVAQRKKKDLTPIAKKEERPDPYCKERRKT